MKEVYERITDTLKTLLSRNLTTDLTRIALISIVDIMDETKELAALFVDLLLAADEELRNWIMYNGQEEEPDQYFAWTQFSLKYKTSIDLSKLKKNAGDMLSYLANKVKGIQPAEFAGNYLDVLIFAFENANFGKMNVEIFDGLINNSFDFLLRTLEYPEICSKGSQILEIYIDYLLRGDVMIQDFDKRMGDFFVTIFNGYHNEEVKENLRAFIMKLNENYPTDKPQYEQFAKIATRIFRKVSGALHNESDETLLENYFKLEDVEDSKPKLPLEVDDE